MFKTIQNSVKLQLYIFFPSYYYSFPENVDNNGSRYIVSTSQNVKLPCNFMQFSKNSSLQTVPRDEKLFKLEVKCMQSCNCCIVTSGQKPLLQTPAITLKQSMHFCQSNSFLSFFIVLPYISHWWSVKAVYSLCQHKLTE